MNLKFNPELIKKIIEMGFKFDIVILNGKENEGFFFNSNRVAFTYTFIADSPELFYNSVLDLKQDETKLKFDDYLIEYMSKIGFFQSPAILNGKIQGFFAHTLAKLFFTYPFIEDLYKKDKLNSFMTAFFKKLNKN